MIISFRKLRERVKFLLLFVLFTLIVYITLEWIVTFVYSSPSFREPEGHAVKVFLQQPASDVKVTLLDRLRLFLWHGG